MYWYVFVHFIYYRDVASSSSSPMPKYNFPRHWPRSDRGVTIIPVKQDVYRRLERLFQSKLIAGQSNLQIQSIEELCNFNTYEAFTM